MGTAHGTRWRGVAGTGVAMRNHSREERVSLPPMQIGRAAREPGVGRIAAYSAQRVRGVGAFGPHNTGCADGLRYVYPPSAFATIPHTSGTVARQIVSCLATISVFTAPGTILPRYSSSISC